MTPNQLKLLCFIARYREQHLNSPTIREMAKEIRVFDAKSALGVLRALERDGYVIKPSSLGSKRRARSAQLSQKAHEFLGLRPEHEPIPTTFWWRRQLLSAFEIRDSSLTEVHNHQPGATGRELEASGTTSSELADAFNQSSALLDGIVNGTAQTSPMRTTVSRLLRSSRFGVVVLGSLAIFMVVAKATGTGPIAFVWYIVILFASLLGARLVKD